LLADHYGKTKFKWNPDEARRFMARTLDGRARGSGEAVHYDDSGKNTLFPLSQGFALVADMCEELLATDPPEVHRPAGDIPTYAERTALDMFPFQHTSLFLDIRQRDRDRIIDLLREVTASMESPDVCELRNRLEHRRRDFPAQEEIEEVCGALTKVFRKMESAGISPLVYYHKGTASDAAGRKVTSFVDYRGRTHDLHHPSQYVLVRLPTAISSLVLVPWLHIGESLDVIRFRIEESSEFTEMWRGYPRRKSRMPTKMRGSETREQPTIESSTTLG
jgi:hypothetical protein